MNARKAIGLVVTKAQLSLASNVEASTPPAQISYRQYSAGVPPYLESEVTVGEFGAGTDIFIGLTPYAEIWINPASTGSFRVH